MTQCDVMVLQVVCNVRVLYQHSTHILMGHKRLHGTLQHRLPLNLSFTYLSRPSLVDLAVPSSHLHTKAGHYR